MKSTSSGLIHLTNIYGAPTMWQELFYVMGYIAMKTINIWGRAYILVGEKENKQINEYLP